MPPRARRRAGWFFVGVGVLASLVMGAYAVLPSVRERLAAAAEEPSLEYSAILPPGASLPSDAAVVRVDDVPVPSYVVGFARAGQGGMVGLATWNRHARRYDWASTLQLDAGDPALGEVRSVERRAIAEGSSVFVVRGATRGAHASGVALVARDGDRLRRVLRTDAGGVTVPAVFLEGASARHREEVQFTDVDGDGREEVVAVSGETGDDGREAVRIAVYGFAAGDLAYDAGLSAAAKAREGLFPEP
jgi:hypothetical protein